MRQELLGAGAPGLAEREGAAGIGRNFEGFAHGIAQIFIEDADRLAL